MAKLIVISADGRQEVDLLPRNTLGRHPNNSIQILDRIVSKEHCIIALEGEGFVLKDLGSLNGTYINAERVQGQKGLRDGDEIALVGVRLKAIHTPGHTYEHVSWALFDDTRSQDTPWLIFTGDFLFVGDVGRPDLLGEESKRELARRLFQSVREKLAPLPDGLEIHPGHGAGSMCGAGMSARPLSTLGFERVANPYLDPALDEKAFVEKILASAPPFPPYYRRMKTLNAAGPPILGDLPGRDPIPVGEFHALVEAGNVVVDLRDQLAFGGGHVPGALGIGVSELDPAQHVVAQADRVADVLEGQRVLGQARHLRHARCRRALAR